MTLQTPTQESLRVEYVGETQIRPFHAVIGGAEVTARYSYVLWLKGEEEKAPGMRLHSSDRAII